MRRGIWECTVMSRTWLLRNRMKRRLNIVAMMASLTEGNWGVEESRYLDAALMMRSVLCWGIGRREDEVKLPESEREVFCKA